VSRVLGWITALAILLSITGGLFALAFAWFWIWSVIPDPSQLGILIPVFSPIFVVGIFAWSIGSILESISRR
jgi:hypothetical protein